MDKTKVFSVACYCRLSKEDERLGESVSIETQRKILEDFCKEKQLAVYDYYIDDGFTGTNFDRPDFQRMIKDIENGNVNMVIVKDLSRFGREHILVGHYIERVFPKMGVTFLALADDVDTSNVNRRQTDRIMMSVRNVFNEMWPADTSDKVRHALEAKASRAPKIAPSAPSTTIARRIVLIMIHPPSDQKIFMPLKPMKAIATRAAETRQIGKPSKHSGYSENWTRSRTLANRTIASRNPTPPVMP